MMVACVQCCSPLPLSRRYSTLLKVSRPKWATLRALGGAWWMAAALAEAAGPRLLAAGGQFGAKVLELLAHVALHAWTAQPAEPICAAQWCNKLLDKEVEACPACSCPGANCPSCSCSCPAVMCPTCELAGLLGWAAASGAAVVAAFVLGTAVGRRRPIRVVGDTEEVRPKGDSRRPLVEASPCTAELARAQLATLRARQHGFGR